MLHRAILVATLLAACGDSSSTTPPPVEVGGARPTAVGVPGDYDADRSYPLLLVLHGYGANGYVQKAYFGAKTIEDRGDAFVLAPDGLVDSSGNQFWNADDVCCDRDNKNPDDVGYLSGIVDEVMNAYPIDPARVYIVGHSNGGFMAYRMACEKADRFAAIVSLAGSAVTVPCDPVQPVNVLHVHGDVDEAVPFELAGSSVSTWSGYNGCTGAAEAGADIDIDNAVPGVETATASTAGCPTGGAVDLWTIRGGTHIPAFSPAWEPAMWQWFTDHHR